MICILGKKLGLEPKKWMDFWGDWYVHFLDPQTANLAPKRSIVTCRPVNHREKFHTSQRVTRAAVFHWQNAQKQDFPCKVEGDIEKKRQFAMKHLIILETLTWGGRSNLHSLKPTFSSLRIGWVPRQETSSFQASMFRAENSSFREGIQHLEWHFQVTAPSIAPMTEL